MAHLKLPPILHPRTLATLFSAVLALSAAPGRGTSWSYLIVGLPLLLSALAWNYRSDHGLSASFAAGAVLLAGIPHQDGKITAVALSVALLQGSWLAYYMSLLVAAASLASVGAAAHIPLAVAPSAIMAIGTLDADRRRVERRELTQTLKTAQERSEQAQRINDHIIQHLALASYARQEGRSEEAAEHAEEALLQARAVVEHLEQQGYPGRSEP